MTDYLELDLTASAPLLYQEGVDAIQAEEPGWEPSVIEAWLLSAVARMAVEVVLLAGRVPVEIFRFFGQTVLRIQSLQATPATGTARFNLSDTLGHTIDAGAQLDVEGIGFVTQVDGTAAPGAGTVDIAIIAIEAGTAGNELSTPVALVSPTLVFVDSVEIVGVTDSGTDGETPQEYVNRLADELPELSPKVVLVPDAQARARRNPLVARALAINRYDPGPPIDTDNEGHISVFVHDIAGATIGSTARGVIAADMEANRINGLVVHVLDPTYTRVDVRFTARCYANFDPATVEADAEQAILDFLNPANWGRGDDATSWVDEETLYRNDLIGVVDQVDGIRHVDTLTLARFGDPQATADVVLDGPASLPAGNSVASGTVTV